MERRKYTMRRKLLFFVAMILGTTGCSNDQIKATSDELQMIQDKIIKYDTIHGVQENYAFNYVDEENGLVVVGLLNNSLEAQEKFKKDVVDSNFVKFVQSDEFVDEASNYMQDKSAFIRTYHILNVAESNDTNYIYLTIRQFQEEEVQTIKVKRSLCPDIIEGKDYEFTIKPNYECKDNLLSIFSHSNVLAIEATNKIGLEQIQDDLPK